MTDTEATASSAKPAQMQLGATLEQLGVEDFQHWWSCSCFKAIDLSEISTFLLQVTASSVVGRELMGERGPADPPIISAAIRQHPTCS